VIASVAGVCEARLFAGAAARAGAPPDLLVEVPHGATRAAQYHSLRAELRGELPADLIDFFNVNTDAGAPEYACALAERLVGEEPSRTVLVLLSEIPRTFIDCNRVLDVSPEEYKAGKVTPGLPPYIRDPRDQALLRARHAAWVSASEEAWRWCCELGGLGLMAHTYAPRSVDVEVDDAIVASLRRAYQAESSWLLRPQIDLIARDPAGAVISQPLVQRLAADLAAAGFDTAVSGTYPLHPSTLAFHRARRYQPRTACLEVRRDLLASQFVPFTELQIAPAKVARIVAPLARAVRAAWSWKASGND
jgi:hypothetical protein